MITLDKSRISFISPSTEEEWESYFEFRWRLLRQPWKQPRGSEKDELDASSKHLIACHEHEVIGVGRLSISEEFVGRIGFMAVSKKFERQGIGKMLIKHLENHARHQGVSLLWVNARESAYEFYQKQGYKVKRDGKVLFGEIRHFIMNKTLEIP